MMGLILALGFIGFGYIIYLAVKKSDPEEIILHDVKVVMPEVIADVVAEVEKPIKAIGKVISKKALKKAAKKTKTKLKKKK
jgi:hypothetical protein